MEALIVLAFCMTALSMPMRTYLPVFVKDIFHRGPETYGNLLVAHGTRFDLRLADCRREGQHQNKGRVALACSSAWAPGLPGFPFQDRCR